MLLLPILALLLCVLPKFSLAQDDDGFPTEVIDDVSSRMGRYHHFLWHYIRDNWNQFDSDVQDEIRERGWEPPRPSRRFDDNGNSVAITDNDSGEDFLYFHRQMIQRARELAGDDDQEYFAGWTSIPDPDDDDYPVPDEYEIPNNSGLTDTINDNKSDDFYEDSIRPLEERFTDEDELRSMTLSELGSRIEFTIHNYLHLRFSSESSYGYRSRSERDTLVAFPDVSERWDDSDYDWLGDTYSSHVNPVFWKLHGWVDDRIEDWRRANNIDEIEWTGTWEGGPMDTISDIIGEDDREGQEEGEFEVDGIDVESDNAADDEVGAVDSSFADNVQVDLGSSGKSPSVSQPTPVTNSRPNKTRKRCKSRVVKSHH